MDMYRKGMNRYWSPDIVLGADGDGAGAGMAGVPAVGADGMPEAEDFVRTSVDRADDAR